MRNFKLIISLSIFIVLISACSTDTTAETLDPIAARGKNLFAQYCAACHDSVGEAIIVGPSLKHIASVAETRIAGLDSKEYIEESLLFPERYLVDNFDDLMPRTFNSLLAQEEIDSLIAYMLTLE